MIPLVILLFLPSVAPDLRSAWSIASTAWSPYVPYIEAVTWDTAKDCEDETGGGHWSESRRTIYICNPIIHDITLIMLHEYGHALGLHHVDRKQRISIMNDGWDEPYGDWPSLEDIQQAANEELNRRRRGTPHRTACGSPNSCGNGA